MAINVPMPDLPGTSLLKGMQTGGNLFAQIMHPVVEREKLKQLENHFQEKLKMDKASAGRAAQAAMDAHKIALNKLNPLYELQQLPARLKLLESMNLGGQNGAPQATGGAQQHYPDLHKMFMGGGAFPQEPQMPQETMPTEEPGHPAGMVSPQLEQMQRPMEEATQAEPAIAQQTNAAANNPYGIDFDAIKKGLMQGAIYKAFGQKAPANGVSPEQKLKDKLTEDEYKHNLKLSEAEQKEDLKVKATKDKLIQDSKNDLPRLNDAMEALNKMEKIAKNNPDLFGHSGLFGFGAQGDAERFASTTNNPNAGKFQSYLTGPLSSGVKELSGRGNQLALKTMLSLKPGFSESQPSALGKIKSMKDMLQKQINNTSKLAGTAIEKTVTVINPQGKKFKTTEENAQHLPKGWRHG